MGAKYVFNPLTGNLDTTDVVAFNGEVNLGTAAAPSVFFTGDTNTGIYSPGPDQVAISTNGTRRLVVDASGNVAVNELAFAIPTGVAKNFTVSTVFSDTDLPGIGLDQRRSSAGSHGSFFWSGRSTGGNPRLLASISCDQTVATIANGGGDIIFNTNPGAAEQPVERLRITSDGKLGLGTSSPQATLNIIGNAFIGSANPYGNDAQDSQLFILGANSNSSTAQLNIGTPDTVVGTSANPYDLNISFRGYLGSEKARIASYDISNNSANSVLRFFVQGTGGVLERMRIAPTGTVGIGDTGPSETLTVKGASSVDPFSVSGPSSEFLRVDDDGRLLVGTSSTSGQNSLLQVVGDECAQFHKGTNDTAPSTLNFSKSRNTAYGSFTIVQDGDRLGSIAFRGDDGTDYLTRAAEIVCEVDGTPGANDMPGRLTFSTTADGASSPTERMRIDNAGTTTITSAAATAPFIAKINTSEAARIDSSGRLLIGASSSTLDGAALQVNGDFSQSSLYQQKVASFTGGDVSTKTLNIVTNNSTAYATSFVELSCAFARGSSPRKYFYKAIFAIEETGATVSALTDEVTSGVTATISFSGQTASLVLTFGTDIQKGTAFIKVVNSSDEQYIQSMSWS